LVLARKYRPTTFSEVVGQEHVTRTLANAFASGRVHHAFLLCGPRGVGKTSLARILGRALNCDKGATSEPCGHCGACTSIADGSAVDYIEMDGASNRGIDAIRELTESVRYQPAVLRKKVYVIDEVHMLTTEAFNALLKTLEEPPPHVTFVLATTEPQKLPNTILSRCQRHDVKLVSASRMAQHLVRIFRDEQLEAEPGAIRLIVSESGGSVRDALSLCDQLISFVGSEPLREGKVAEVLGVADRGVTRALVTSLASGDAAQALATAESALQRGVDEVQIARALVRALRDMSILRAAGNRPELVDATDDERQQIIADSATIATERLTQMFDRMLRCCDDLGRTQYPRFVLDFALIDLAALEPVLPLGELISRLQELEVRVTSGAGARPSPGRPVGGGGSGASRSPPQAPPARGTGEDSRRNFASAPGDAPSGGGREPSGGGREPSGGGREPSGGGREPSGGGREPSGGGREPSGGTPSGAAQIASQWERVLTALEERRRFALLGYYQHARVMAWTDESVELGFPQEFHSLGEMAREKSKLDEMKEFFRQQTGKVSTITVRLLDEGESAAPQRSSVEAERERIAVEKQRREIEARQHPLTQAVLQTFGAQIKEIKTDV
jgi:DNA polymerase-3 subunit gamma/tau